MKVPSQLDIESHTTQFEMNILKNKPQNSTNVTEQIPNKTNSTGNSNQTIESTNSKINSTNNQSLGVLKNGTLNVTELIANRVTAK